MADRECDDSDLLRLVRESPDEASRGQAAAQLLGRYRTRVYAWCMRHVRDHDLALDLAQDILLAAFRNLASYRGQAPFAGWLWAIARNRCLNELRRPSLLGDDDVDPESIPTTDRRPDELLEDRLAEDALLALIRESLEPLEQQALRLRCFERMPVDTITRALGIREATGARAVLQRARRKLRTALVRQTRAREEEV
jgi:RNA polymerase sigma-70 factor, ECF subfamily